MALQSLDVGVTCHRKYELARHMLVQLLHCNGRASFRLVARCEVVEPIMLSAGAVNLARC